MKGHNITEKEDFHKTLIIDIETVPLTKDWEELPAALQKHWEYKVQFLHIPEQEKEHPYECFSRRAGIYSEFGKVVCVGLGFIDARQGQENLHIRLKSIYDHDEKKLLHNFCELVSAFEQQNKEVIFCGHNIKEFDLPYLCRRMLINGLSLPKCLKMNGLKPWQVAHKDTMELWRFGDYKHYTSLDLLAAVLGVNSSKTDMDGSMVGHAYWQENDLESISSYCLQDIYTTAMVYLKLKGITDDLIPEYIPS